MQEELMLGNYLLDREDTLCRVEEITKGGFKAPVIGSALTHLPNKPIPLTEDWLIKFDFIKIDHIHGYSFFTLSKSKINKCHIDVYKEKTTWMNYSVKMCKYVHQLQSLYFAITGEELKLKQSK